MKPRQTGRLGSHPARGRACLYNLDSKTGRTLLESQNFARFGASLCFGPEPCQFGTATSVFRFESYLTIDAGGRRPTAVSTEGRDPEKSAECDSEERIGGGSGYVTYHQGPIWTLRSQYVNSPEFTREKSQFLPRSCIRVTPVIYSFSPARLDHKQ